MGIIICSVFLICVVPENQLFYTYYKFPIMNSFIQSESEYTGTPVLRTTRLTLPTVANCTGAHHPYGPDKNHQYHCKLNYSHRDGWH